MIDFCREVYLINLDIMKKTLDLLSFKFDKKSENYEYLKKEVMNYTYNGLKEFYKKLEKEKLIIKCKCGTNVRKGYKKCSCGGSGYLIKQ